MLLLVVSYTFSSLPGRRGSKRTLPILDGCVMIISYLSISRPYGKKGCNNTVDIDYLQLAKIWGATLLVAKGKKRTPATYPWFAVNLTYLPSVGQPSRADFRHGRAREATGLFSWFSSL